MLVVNQRPPSAPRRHLQFLATWPSQNMAACFFKATKEERMSLLAKWSLIYYNITVGETSITFVIFSWLEARHGFHSHFKGRGSHKSVNSRRCGVSGSYLKVSPPWPWNRCASPFDHCQTSSFTGRWFPAQTL